MTFGGSTFDEGRDGERLRRQYRAVYNYMLDGRWHTLREVGTALGYPTPSVSARFRDMRKDKFGAHVVLRKYIKRGLFEYKLIPNRIVYCPHGLDATLCLTCNPQESQQEGPHPWVKL